ncbi:MAG: arginine repressor [Ignavibacteriales bacterium]|nr:arginine repressor [Ignavibacteriales bacterium]
MKQKRQLAIKEILGQRIIATQEELAQALKKAGFAVTQATLSRDLRELGVGRVSVPEGPRYVLQPENEEQKMRAFLGYEIEGIRANESVVVVKTLPGRAQGVAEIIDNLRHPLVLGTLAGDNTILVTPASVKKIPDVMRVIRSLMSEQARRRPAASS